MQPGGIWGQGTYQAPDWSADYYSRLFSDATYTNNWPQETLTERRSKACSSRIRNRNPHCPIQSKHWPDSPILAGQGRPAFRLWMTLLHSGSIRLTPREVSESCRYSAILGLYLINLSDRETCPCPKPS
ncbi:hypothetical protein [Marinobacter lipolyticus]|uniref:hypothetical protein n=1 Tax=Marinobacter lipolyticus TaxID=209639 RepID=UPI00389932AD